MKSIGVLCILSLIQVLQLPKLFANNENAFDITFYHLSVNVKPDNKSIVGSNQITFKPLYKINSIELDLDTNFLIDSIVLKNQAITFQYKRLSKKILIYFNTYLSKKNDYSLIIYYHGVPHIAPHAPWEGGFVWSKDSLNNDWIGVACETEGGSLWWPCKDTPSDEPDSMKISVTCPSKLFCASNGTLIKVEEKDSLKTYHWEVHYPINNYNVTLNIGDYVHFTDTLYNKDGSGLPLDYYVLRYNLNKAMDHFQQVKTILKVYEKFFGPYPFPKDGYALIETSYWGMEHQSAISYGNRYRNNMGPFDFIIAHETAHEWWGNNITAQKKGQLWIHEAFATYSESLLIEDQLGESKAIEYLEKQKLRIKNENPVVVQTTDIRQEDTDIYYKGTWMLHTLRHCINNDYKWFKTILEFSEKNQHQILSTEDVIKFFSHHLSSKLTPVFSHYLYTTSVPELHYFLKTNKNGKLIIEYHWRNVGKNFKMPFVIEINEKKILLSGKTKKRRYNLGVSNTSVVRVQTQLQYIEAVQDGSNN